MEDGVVFKRVFHSPYEKHDNHFLLVSDNPSFEPFEVEVGDVQQIWQAYKIISDVS
jgi:phage repressor protein C with HTH and peptisase S24 domain